MDLIVRPIATLFFCGCIFLVSVSFAQKTRIEIPAHPDKDHLEIVPLSESGFVLSKENKHEIELTCFDRQFETSWKLNIPLSQKYTTVHYYTSPKELFILLSKSQSHDIHILHVNLNSGTHSLIPIYTVENMKIKDLIALGQDLYVSAEVMERPLLLHINLETQKTHSFSFESRGETRINPIRIDERNGMLYLSVTNSSPQGYQTVLHTYFKGKSVDKISLPASEDKHLLNAQWLPLPQQAHFVIGNYNLKLKREISQGIFTTQVDQNGKSAGFRYYNYAQDKNSFGYLEADAQQEMWEKIIKLQHQNKPYQMRYHSEPQMLHTLGDKIILVDNAFDVNLSPKRYSSNRTYVNLPRGWYYSHTTLSAFSLSGRHLWSSAMNIDQLKSEKKRELIQLGFREDTVISALIAKNKVFYKYHYPTTTHCETFQRQVCERTAGEKITQYSSYQIKTWFNENFLLSGFQRIKSSSGKRDVFFVEAIGL